MSVPKELADELARSLPEGARVIGLLLPEGSGESEAVAVDQLATAVASLRRRTLLTNLAPGSPLDRRLGAEGEPGVPQVVEGEASLEAAALRPGERPFLYLRAGRSAFEPSRMLTAGAFGRLARRLRGLEGTLLVALPATDVAAADVSGLLDGVVVVGGGEGEGTGAGVPVLGALEAEAGGEPDPASAPDAAEATGEASAGEPGPAPVVAGKASEPDREAGGGAPGAADAPPPAEPAPGAGAPGAADAPRSPEPEGRWERHAAEGGFPAAKVAGAVLLVAALFAGWWFLVRQAGPPSGTGPGEGGEGAGAASPAAAESVPGPGGPSRGAAALGAGGGPEAGGAPGAEGWAALVSEADELPYSVLIASYSSLPDARERLDERSGEEVPYFLAPTPVRGRLYHRLFAGIRSDRASADSLMRALVRTGRKEGASDWDVRPVPFAFRLGVYADREEARREVERLARSRIPAYLVPVGREERRVWQVYAGAYETEEEAAAMRRTLESAGEEARLVRRRGVER